MSYTRETAIAVAKTAYVLGKLALDAFEAEIEGILSPDWTPPQTTKVDWSDAPGGVDYYRPAEGTPMWVASTDAPGAVYLYRPA